MMRPSTAFASPLIAAFIAAAAVLTAVPAQAQFTQQIIPSIPKGRIVVPQCSPGELCAVQSPQFGLRCQTQTFWCGISQPGPVGMNCFCNTPNGAVPGRVMQ